MSHCDTHMHHCILMLVHVYIHINIYKSTRVFISLKVVVRGKFSVSNLLLTSLLAGTDGPAGFSAGGLWARGEEGLSSSGTSVATTSTVSTGWIGVSDGNKNIK